MARGSITIGIASRWSATAEYFQRYHGNFRGIRGHRNTLTTVCATCQSDLSGSMWHDAFRLCAESPYDPAVDLGALASSIRTVVDKFKRASELLMDNVPGRLISEDMLGSYALPG